jgi:hypothetical protein
VADHRYQRCAAAREDEVLPLQERIEAVPDADLEDVDNTGYQQAVAGTDARDVQQIVLGGDPIGDPAADGSASSSSSAASSIVGAGLLTRRGGLSGTETAPGVHDATR